MLLDGKRTLSKTNAFDLVVTVTLLATLLAGCAREVQQPPERPTVVSRGRGKPAVASSPRALLRKDGVRQLQQALRARGFRVPLDGNYDRETQRAVLSFQRQHKLAATSMPDLETLDELGLDAERLYRKLARTTEGGRP